jgi:hypothetical protein
VRILHSPLAIPLFDRLPHHSSVPTKVCAAAARSGGPGRPKGRREAALPWTGASAAACLHLSVKAVGAVAMMLSLVMAPERAVQAEAAPAISPAKSQAAYPFADFIAEASRRFAVPVHWIRAVIGAESAGEVRARSPKGAMGLTQMMPQTWADLRVRYNLGIDPYDPRDNILAGTAYLRELHDRFGPRGFLAAYNAEPTRYEEHLAGRPLPAETLAYLAVLAPLLGKDEFAAASSVGSVHGRSWRAAPLFTARVERTIAADLVPAGRQSNVASAALDVHDVSGIMPKSTGLFVARLRAGERQ